MKIAWWAFPALMFATALVLFVRSHLKSVNKPKWVGVGPFIFPNPVGIGSYLGGIFFILLGLVFLAGHYLK